MRVTDRWWSRMIHVGGISSGRVRVGSSKAAGPNKDRPGIWRAFLHTEWATVPSSTVNMQGSTWNVHQASSQPSLSGGDCIRQNATTNQKTTHQINNHFFVELFALWWCRQSLCQCTCVFSKGKPECSLAIAIFFLCPEVCTSIVPLMH